MAHVDILLQWYSGRQKCRPNFTRNPSETQTPKPLKHQTPNYPHEHCGRVTHLFGWQLCRSGILAIVGFRVKGIVLSVYRDQGLGLRVWGLGLEV